MTAVVHIELVNVKNGAGEDVPKLGIKAVWSDGTESERPLEVEQVLALIEKARELILASVTFKPPASIAVVGPRELKELKRLERVN